MGLKTITIFHFSYTTLNSRYCKCYTSKKEHLLKTERVNSSWSDARIYRGIRNIGFVSTTFLDCSLVDGAKLEIQDNRASLFLAPFSYATIPRFDFHQTDLTIAVWVKLKSTSDNQMFILNDEGGSGRSFSFYLFDQGKLKVEWFYSSGSNFLIVER